MASSEGWAAKRDGPRDGPPRWAAEQDAEQDGPRDGPPRWAVAEMRNCICHRRNNFDISKCKSITKRILISEPLGVEVARYDGCLPLICLPSGATSYKADGAKGCRRLSGLAISECGLTDGNDHMAGGLRPSSPRDYIRTGMAAHFPRTASLTLPRSFGHM